MKKSPKALTKRKQPAGNKSKAKKENEKLVAVLNMKSAKSSDESKIATGTSRKKANIRENSVGGDLIEEQGQIETGSSTARLNTPATNLSETDSSPVELLNLFTLLKSNTRIPRIIKDLTGKEHLPTRKRGSNSDNIQDGGENILAKKSFRQKLVAELINLICRSCGSTVDIQPWQVEDNVDSILEEVFTRIHDQSPNAYVVGNNDGAHRHFRRNYAVFWRSLLTTFSVADITLLSEDFTPWLLAMTESKSRAFRHSASIAAFSMITGLTQSVLEKLSTIEESGARGRVLQPEIDTLNTAAFSLYSKVFVRRARDVHQPIRALAVDSLCDWVRIYPAEYLKPEYTKNLGFLLHDKSPEIRRRALDVVSTLYTQENEEHDGLRRFTDRFRERIVELTRDIDTNCVEVALRLCTQIMRYDHHNDHLHLINESYPKEAMHMVLRTVFDEKPAVRRAAGALLDLVLKLNTTGYAQDERAGKRIEMLLRFIMEAREVRCISGAAWYVVDAMFTGDDDTKGATKKDTTVRKKAESIPSVLDLHYDEIIEFSTSSKADISLIRSALETLSAIAGRVTPQAESTQNSESAMHADFHSNALLAIVSNALEKHSGMPDMIPVIAGMLQHICPQHVTDDNPVLIGLFREMGTIFLRSTEYAALNPIASFFEAITPAAASIHQPIRESFQRLVETVSTTVSRESSTASWKRAHALYRVADLGDLNLRAKTILQEILTRLYSAETTDIDTDKIMSISGCVYRACFWSVIIAKAKPLGQSVMAADIESAQGTLLKVLEFYIPKSPNETVDLFCAVCDISSIDGVPVDPVLCDKIPSLYCALVDSLTQKHSELISQRQEELKKKPEGNVIEHISLVHASVNNTLRGLEVDLGKITAGISRLAKFGALSLDDMSKILRVWPRMPEKFLSDALKDLFRLVKTEIHRTGKSRVFPSINPQSDRFALEVSFELSILYEALSVLTENDTEAPHLQDFQNLCVRLAQTHFMPQTEANYRVVVAVTQRLLQTVAEKPTTHAALLCAVIPYASRLRAEHAKNITRDFLSNSLNSVPEYFRRVFVSAIRKRVPAELKSTQESIDLTDGTAELPALHDVSASSETLLATPVVQQTNAMSSQSAMTFQDLSLGHSTGYFDKGALTGSMETFLSTGQSPSPSSPTRSPSQHLVDTIARPSANAERSSLIAGDESSEYFLESQVLYE